MNDDIVLSMAFCAASVFATLAILRRDRVSLGLPFAYLFTLHLNHVPGAYAHLIRPDLFQTTPAVALGLWHTAIGSLCFVVGLWVARSRQPTIKFKIMRQSGPREVFQSAGTNQKFWLFCLIGGWLFVYVLTPFLATVPSVGAVVEKGGAIWMLGLMLGLRDALERFDIRAGISWIICLSVYPTLMLLLGGFLSYGTSAVIITISVLAVAARSLWLVIVGCIVIFSLGLTLFVNYFIVRDDLRAVLWSGAGFEERIKVTSQAFSKIEALNLDNAEHAIALDQRLNQNYFAGLAAENIQNGWSEFRYGQSFYEALISPIPRAIWPEKPVFGGSGTIVREMTGLELNLETSWGVGQVMEFYINFGWISLLSGFFCMGWLIGMLDMRAAMAEKNGNIHKLFVCFLPAVALIQPIGSLVELFGGAAAAYLAAVAWSWGWKIWSTSRSVPRPRRGL